MDNIANIDNNVTVRDNGICFMVCVNGLMICRFNSLGSAWNYIAWLHRVVHQNFTVGEKKIPVKEWLENGIKYGYLEENVGLHQ